MLFFYLIFICNKKKFKFIFLFLKFYYFFFVKKNRINGKLDENPVSNSKFINDEIITSHPRFQALTRNIKDRRGEKPNIKIPIFSDINSKDQDINTEPYPGFIYMDAMGFGKLFIKIM